MRDFLRAGANANSGGRFAASRDDRRASCADARETRRPRCSARTPSGIVFGANMTTLNFALHPRASRARSGPATRSSAPGSTTTPTSPPGGSPPTTPAPTWCSPRSTSTTGRLDRRRGRRRSSARAPGGSRSPARRTRSGRCPTLAPIVGGGARGRRPGASSTRCTSPRTGPSTSPRSAATRSSRRRTSGTARTPACCGSRPTCATGAHAVQGAARARHRARALGDRHPGVRGDRGDPRPRPRSCSTRGPRRHRPPRSARCSRRCSTGLLALPHVDGPRTAGPRGPHADGVLLGGRARPRTRSPTALAARRGRGLGRQLLRGRGDGRARPHRRRRDPGRGVLLHDTERRRPSPRRGRRASADDPDRCAAHAPGVRSHP